MHGKNLVTGLLYTAFGLATAIMASGYRMGTPVSMGPGFFPFWLGVALAVIGVVLVITSARRSGAARNDDGRLQPWDLRSLAIIALSVVVFGVALPWLGLMISTVLLVMVSSLASREFGLKATLINVVVLLVITYVVFVLGLGLQIRVWPAFI